MKIDLTRIPNIVVIGLAVTLGIVIAVWLFLPRPSALSAEALYRQAGRLIRTGDYPTAEQKLRQALEQRPNDARLHFALGRALMGLKMPDEALISFQQAISLNPENRDYRFEAGVALLTGRREKIAEDIFRGLVQRYPRDLPALYQLGALQSRRGRYAEAAETFKIIVTQEPGEAEAWNNLGFCYYNLGRSEDALEAIGKALSLKPDFDKAKTNREIIRQESQAASPVPK